MPAQPEKTFKQKFIPKDWIPADEANFALSKYEELRAKQDQKEMLISMALGRKKYLS